MYLNDLNTKIPKKVSSIIPYLLDEILMSNCSAVLRNFMQQRLKVFGLEKDWNYNYML